MRAFTRSEALQLAIEDAYLAARNTPRFARYFKKSERIRNRRGWRPWWAPTPTECSTCGIDDWHRFFDRDRGKWRRACRECRRQRDRRREGQ